VSERGRIAVVTGASSGIGEATSAKLAQEGFQIVLVARRKERLEAVADHIRMSGARAWVLPTDLADEDECDRVFTRVQEEIGPTDVLVNNAGFGWYGFGESMTWETARQMIEVNMAALTHLTLLFLSKMKERGRGHIINIGSIAGSIPSQGVALYSATKAFIDALTTSLYRELMGTNVKVSVVRAGATATAFFDHAAKGPQGLRIPVDRLAITPEKVANRVWRLIKKPTRVAYVPAILSIVPWIELSFGWLMDRIGPMLLRYQLKRSA
jgi:short-subunit dehydrogenase